MIISLLKKKKGGKRALCESPYIRCWKKKNILKWKSHRLRSILRSRAPTQNDVNQPCLRRRFYVHTRSGIIGLLYYGYTIIVNRVVGKGSLGRVVSSGFLSLSKCNISLLICQVVGFLWGYLREVKKGKKSLLDFFFFCNFCVSITYIGLLIYNKLHYFINLINKQ